MGVRWVRADDELEAVEDGAADEVYYGATEVVGGVRRGEGGGGIFYVRFVGLTGDEDEVFVA